MARAHLIHGIHTDGQAPILGLSPPLRSSGFEVLYPDYGWIAGLETKVVNPIIVGSLLPYIAPGDVLIGHSNGCAIIYDLLNKGAQPAAVAFVNAALERSIVRPAWVKQIDVYFNPGDEITEVAELSEKLGITDPVWGEMGHAGYLGSDAAITNIDCGATPGMPVVSGHSDFFTPSKLDEWGKYLVGRLASYGIS
jgi:hypothetical protein